MKQNKTVMGGTMGRGIVLGAVISMAVTLICTAVFGAMVSAGTIRENVVGYISIGILLLATVIGTLSGIRNVQEKKLYCGLGIAAVYFGLLISMTALFFGGQYDRVTVTSFVLFLGAIGGMFLGKGKGSGSNLRSRKIKRR